MSGGVGGGGGQSTDLGWPIFPGSKITGWEKFKPYLPSHLDETPVKNQALRSCRIRMMGLKASKSYKN